MTAKHSFSIYTISKFAVLILIISTIFAACSPTEKSAEPIPISKTRTLSVDAPEKLGEPFGIAYKDGTIYFSDGETGRIWRINRADNAAFPNVFNLLSEGFNTPSQIAFDQNGDLIIADSGTHQIKRLKIETGAVEIVAGVENQKGFADGEANAALFNAPVGVAVLEDKIYVADTYNDKIRVIQNGKVLTLSGGEKGFADGVSYQTKFDTPCGLAIWKNKILVADAGNRRIRAVETDGKTWTLAGNGAEDLVDGFPLDAAFVEPIAVSTDKNGAIYVTDGNAIRAFGRRFFPFVETLTARKRGFNDGALRQSRFNRPSGLANDEDGNVFVADSDNQNIRVLTNAEVFGTEVTKEMAENLRVSAEQFRTLSAPRWSYNPPEKKREIAGTLGEIRGEMVERNSQVWFHNGLDIVGGYGETARFVRTEKVLHPLAAENFAMLRELLRMPTLGYIHIRLGRDQNDRSFNDSRFNFSTDASGKINGVRVPRGAKFEAGEAVGTLNPMNHVHLIAGRSGAEMNALDALVLPDVSDKIEPTITNVALFDENWQSIGETQNTNARIKLNSKTRVVVRAYDRMDGNAERRRLGVFKVGYQILKTDKTPVSETDWTISFARLPDSDAVNFVYASGSKSGATGETIFNYIATNRVNGDDFREDFFDAGKLETGTYVLRVFAADYFGNTTSKDINFER